MADPFAEFGGRALSESNSSEATPAPAPTTEAPNSDPFAAFGGHAISASPTPIAAATVLPSPAADPFAAFGGKSLAPPPKEAEDTNAPWYKKAWDWANTPLVDEQSVERWLGREGNASGFEKGVYDLASGLTSPLSIALMIGTWGSGALFESGGAAMLSKAGWAAKDIEEVAKGSEVVAQAVKMGKDAEGALQAAGFNSAKVMSGLNELKEAGLNTEALNSTGI